MNGDLLDQANTFVNTYLVPFGWKLAGAVAVWIVGGWVIKLLRARWIRRSRATSRPAPT